MQTGSLCCQAPLQRSFSTPLISTFICELCGTYWARHLEMPEGDPWKSKTITPQFLEALRIRREIQMEQIWNRFGGLLSSNKVLDYGCGSGAFVAFLRARGVQASGCDLSDVCQAEGLVRLQKSWEVPKNVQFSLVMLMDVFEHCDRPDLLIQNFLENGARHFLVKVPLTTGPLFQVSRLLLSLGVSGFLHDMFLAGEPAPHLSYFSPAGLASLFGRYSCRTFCRLRIAEIGREFPRRLREQSWSTNVPRSVMLKTAGLFLEGISAAWSDTSVFHFAQVSATTS